MTPSGTLAEPDLEPYRRELTGFCYRMLGSGFEADDAVQETMVRAWRHGESFEGRSSVRSWLYRIASNVCIDMHRQVQRRARPMDLGPSSPPFETNLGPVLVDHPWVMPVNDAAMAPETHDPAELAEHRESIRLAFVTALQHLPSRQRAVLILCEVLRFPAAEVAGMLETSVAAVNSALQRARARLESLPDAPHPGPLDPADAELLEAYVEAFQSYDMGRLVELLHEDAVQSMPPFSMWIQGAGDITTFMQEPAPSSCRGSFLVPLSANGCPAFAQYKPAPEGGYVPWAVQVLEVHGGRIAELAFFLNLCDPERLFPYFGLPLSAEAADLAHLGRSPTPARAPRA